MFKGLFGGTLFILPCVEDDTICVMLTTKKTKRRIYFDKKACKSLSDGFKYFAETLKEFDK